MPEVTDYSLGLDLGRAPWRLATVRDGVAAVSTAPDEDASTASDFGTGLGWANRISAAILLAGESRGALPSTIVVSLTQDQRTGNEHLAGEVARQLGLRPDQVTLIDEAAASALGWAHLNDARRSGADIVTGDDPSTCVAALGAALSAAASAAGPMSGGVLAAGTGGMAVGGIGAAILTGEPTAAVAATTGVAGPAGVSVGTGAAGPVGVSVGTGAAGPAGVSVATGAAGPAGVPLATGAAGPAGVPLAIGNVRWFARLPVIGGAAAVVIVAAVAVVVATSNDEPTTQPVVTEAVLNTENIVDSVTVTVPGLAPITAPASIVASSTLPVTVPPVSASDCVVGSWLGDNDAFLAAMNQAAGDAPVKWDSVTGTMRLDVGADGAVATTYDNWTQTSNLGGAGIALVTVNGVDTNTVVFADDGTYAVTASEIGTTTKLSSPGFVYRDGPSQGTMFVEDLTYTCSGDRLEIETNVANDFAVFQLNWVFTRSA